MIISQCPPVWVSDSTKRGRTVSPTFGNRIRSNKAFLTRSTGPNPRDPLRTALAAYHLIIEALMRNSYQRDTAFIFARITIMADQK